MAHDPALRRHIDARLAVLKRQRHSWEPGYRELSRFINPRRGQFWSQPNQGGRGAQANSSILDPTALFALRTLVAGLMSGVTSPARPWFRLSIPDRRVASLAPVKVWLDECAERMRMVFNSGNLYSALPMMYEELGQFGSRSETGGQQSLGDALAAVGGEGVKSAGKYLGKTGAGIGFDRLRGTPWPWDAGGNGAGRGAAPSAGPDAPSPESVPPSSNNPVSPRPGPGDGGGGLDGDASPPMPLGLKTMWTTWESLPPQVRAAAPLEVRDSFRIIEADTLFSGRNRLAVDPLRHEKYEATALNAVLRGRPVELGRSAHNTDPSPTVPERVRVLDDGEVAAVLREALPRGLGGRPVVARASGTVKRRTAARDILGGASPAGQAEATRDLDTTAHAATAAVALARSVRGGGETP